MRKKRRHIHSLGCIVVRKGQAHCKLQLARAKRAALTRGQKKCAGRFIAEEVSSGKKDPERWSGGRKQAVAVGISRARKECR